MKGYIGITAREWFEYLSSKDNIYEVNFWRKNTNNFRALDKGDPFFFLVKNEKNNRGERAVLGKATYERFEVMTVSEAWEKYGQANGDGYRESFITRMNTMFEADPDIGEIGCIILSDFQVFDNPVYLSEIGIEFKSNIVSGKVITREECNLILEHAFTMKTVIQKLNDAEQMGLTEDDEGFPEGRRLLKQHLIRERNPKVVRLAKERFLKKHGTLFCEVCHFNFKDRYGDLGDGYIECHHTKPISEMSDDDETKIEDIALVCANCHRMLHRKRPWPSIEELRRLLK